MLDRLLDLGLGLPELSPELLERRAFPAQRVDAGLRLERLRRQLLH